MNLTRERFEQGMTYTDYKQQMTRNRDRFEENERLVELDAEDVAFFAQLPQPLAVLVLTEDWCGDAIANVPVLGRLAEASGTLELRLFLRDQNLDIMDQYLNRGEHRSIPVFVFFDQDFRELGHWIERPQLITQLQAQMMQELAASHPEIAGFGQGVSPAQMSEEARSRMQQAFIAFRQETRASANREVVREIRALVAAGLAA